MSDATKILTQGGHSTEHDLGAERHPMTRANLLDADNRRRKSVLPGVRFSA